jgi:integrase
VEKSIKMWKIAKVGMPHGARWHRPAEELLVTGLRIGESLGLKTEDVSLDGRKLDVRRSIWHLQEQAPKTANAIRTVDVPKLFAEILSAYVSGTSGYLFKTHTGRPLGQRNVLRPLHTAGARGGFHVFRRFRTETLRRAAVPEPLIKAWLGHAKETVTDFYAGGLQKDEAWRREWCERAGLGFSVVTLLHANVVAIDVAKVA